MNLSFFGSCYALLPWRFGMLHLVLDLILHTPTRGAEIHDVLNAGYLVEFLPTTLSLVPSEYLPLSFTQSCLL